MIDSIRESVEAVLGAQMTGFWPLSGGLTHASAGRAALADGRTVFIKAGLDEHSGPQVAAEIDHLRVLHGSFVPVVVATVEDPPILVLEDLSAGRWPEPYPDDLTGIEAALTELRATRPPPGLELRTLGPPDGEVLSRLAVDARDGVPRAAAWVERLGAEITAAVESIDRAVSLAHTDLWYSNICFLEDRVVFVDWSHMALAPSWFDASTVSIDLVIGGRRPLSVDNPIGWAAAHTVWTVWSLARGPGPSIADGERWIADNLELFDGAAWWFAHELGVEPPARLTAREVGWS